MKPILIAGICGLLLVLLGMGVGLGIAFSIRPAKDKEPLANENHPKKAPAKVESAAKKATAIGRERLIGKWEPLRDGLLTGKWEFRADGTGEAFIPGIASGEMEWSLQGEFVNVDVGSGIRFRYRPQCDGTKLVLMPSDQDAARGVWSVVLKRTAE